MSVAVFDASVAVKWFVADDLLAAPALAARGEFEPAAPSLIQIEVANALWKYLRAGRVDLDDVIESVEVLGKIMVLYPDDDLLAPAQRLAAQLTHSVYDCLYLSLAQRLSCPLVTADRRLAERAIHLGVSTTLIAPE